MQTGHYFCLFLQGQPETLELTAFQLSVEFTNTQDSGVIVLYTGKEKKKKREKKKMLEWPVNPLVLFSEYKYHLLFPSVLVYNSIKSNIKAMHDIR